MKFVPETARSYIQQNEHVEVIAGVISPAHESYAKETTNLVANNYRRDMVNLSLSSSDWIRLSEWELDQCAWTQSRLVLRYHQVCINLENAEFINKKNYKEKAKW